MRPKTSTEQALLDILVSKASPRAPWAYRWDVFEDDREQTLRMCLQWFTGNGVVETGNYEMPVPVEELERLGADAIIRRAEYCLRGMGQALVQLHG